MENTQVVCKSAKKCGSCQYQGMSYEKQLAKKQARCENLLHDFCRVSPIIGMEDPYYYRNKVHAVFDRDKKGNIISGTYEANSHRVVPIENCLIEDRKCQEIIATIRGMLRSFRIKTYDEDSGYGLLRHVLVRRGFTSGEIMVVLVIGNPIFPSKNNFVKALLKAHPEITTIVLNINDKQTSMVLGEREKTIYGPGFIRDRLCGLTFRISPKSFYQVNPVQTERLYQTAVQFAGLRGKERVLDAYCGIGTIGMIAAAKAGEVTGIELNRDAVRDAKLNARENRIGNIRFLAGDAGEFMRAGAEDGIHPDVVFMDPPRSGSDEVFLSSLAGAAPERVVYISCEPETLARDLRYLVKHGYEVRRIQPFDQFPFTEKCEVCAELRYKA
ncbi:MAG: 23S rRNA (uracil(1939)-C(5))-methyltransferase RlmD [Eubacteriales bacterium]|nr:23S rRNA (uracil(1939)-C(5))-methyltransferase RlmD [Eubacteriales bacterium]